MPPVPTVDKFVFQPGGTNRRLSEGAAIYTNFATLYADFTASTAVRKEILLDDAFSATVTIPAGSYNLNGGKLVGRYSTRTMQEGQVMVSFPSGVTITNMAEVENIAVNHPAGVGTPIVYGSGTTVAPVIRRCLFTCPTGNPLISITNGTTCNFHVLDRSFIGQGQVVFTMAANTSIGFRLGGNSIINDDVILGDATTTCTGVNADAGSKINQAQSNFAGTGSFADNAASDVMYVATSSANWNGTPPNTVADALDRIASALGPIT